MGMQLNKFFLIILVLFSSCKGEAQENYAVSKKTKQTVTTAGINFFDKKYAAQYTMIVDESTPADHPIKTFLDCTDSYFTIHYIPKTQTLEDYWRNQYFKNNDIDKVNFETESKIIEKKINESSKDYTIFCYYVPSKFLKSNAGCSSESVYLDDRTNAEIYYYDNQENKWKLIKQEFSNVLPRILESKYFKTNFPSYFAKDSKTTIETKTPQKAFSWLGNYSCNFLRMKEESGDPRGWGMIRLKIKKDSMKFGLDTYIENFEKDVVILKQTENEIILSLKNKKDSTFVITKNNNKYFLKSNFINETVGETETYELKKE